MANKIPLKISGGIIEQFQAGDTIPASIAPGTPSADNTLKNVKEILSSPDFSGTYINVAAGATLGATGTPGFYTAGGFNYTIWTGGNPNGPAAGAGTQIFAGLNEQGTIQIVMSTRTLAGAGRTWVGLFSSSANASDDPAVQAAGFRFSSIAGDTKWQTYTNDGVAGGTIKDSLVTVVANTRYVLKIVMTTTQIDFYINDVLVTSHTTNLPGGTTTLKLECSASGGVDIAMAKAYATSS